MSDVWGNKLKVSIFGESHGAAIGIVIDGLPPGHEIDMENVAKEMKRRAPGQSALTTPRKEKDQPEIVSGYFNDRTTGSSLTAIIRNSDTRSKDYSLMKKLMRPGQADYPGYVRYEGFNDYRGSGHFSGRITAPLVFAGAIAKQLLEKQGITIGAHLKSVANIQDESFSDCEVTPDLLRGFSEKELPLLNEALEPQVREIIREAKAKGDSLGGTAEVCVLGIPAGIGNPFFDSVESVLSHIIFSVPAVKGLEFGAGFGISEMLGSEANDSYYYEGDTIKTRTNHNGGIVGGITDGMPILFKVAIKPPASISIKQQTIDIEEKTNAELVVEGRHDPIIVPRAIPVLEAVTAIAILDLLLDSKLYKNQ
ncbi:chorismate synthase signature 1 [Trichococcus palustris]|uniref:Chorismate synthase n=1 Tax=Trichococcus palustris TaxID=140314 RepID=A0A143Y431_9LACT|nr:chorismate synthase [Trichococcus palustris]CZQ81118.1 chorismate synthase signature 1 [Trichococcus palustris]SFK63240.1 chorismate synthase [Trichococcus palustris]